MPRPKHKILLKFITPNGTTVTLRGPKIQSSPCNEYRITVVKADDNFKEVAKISKEEAYRTFGWMVQDWCERHANIMYYNGQDFEATL